MALHNTMILRPAATAAEREAAANFSANLRALSATQARLVEAVQGMAAPVGWIYGRDGSLTAMHADGRWWSGCSLPRRAAQAMLESLEIRADSACFLAPAHAAQVAVALEMTRPQQAIVAVVPEPAALRIMLSCAGFAAAVAAGRLWIAWGGQWPAELHRLLADQAHLPVPGQFIRTAATPQGLADALIAPAEQVLAEAAAARDAAAAGR